MGISLENIRKDVRMHKETDRQMSSVWILVYILPIIVAVIAFGYLASSMLSYIAEIIQAGYPDTYPYYAPTPEMSTFMTATTATIVIGYVVNLVLIYLLVDRRNKHFKRQKFLCEDLISAIHRMEKSSDETDSGLSSIERTVKEAGVEETNKDAVLFALLAGVVPFLALYVYYFLMKDFYRHEKRENWFWRDLSMTLDKLGVNFSVPRRTENMPDRSFALYFILSIITANLFGVYWLYVLLKDPNEHFKYHIEVERELLNALETVAD